MFVRQILEFKDYHSSFLDSGGRVLIGPLIQSRLSALNMQAMKLASSYLSFETERIGGQIELPSVKSTVVHRS